MDGDALKTPLGEVVLDRAAGDVLVAHGKRISYNYGPHSTGEHSAENEIPFIQAALPGTGVVIGLIGDHDVRTLDDLVGALIELAKKKKVLVVASTDLLHDPNYELVTETDRKTMAGMEAMDCKGLMTAWSTSNQICCGIMPVLAAMRFAESQGCVKGTALHYRNSGDDYPESRGSLVVGYGSLVFVVSDQASTE
jgi:AmmeMemoRadiSam system protein B